MRAIYTMMVAALLCGGARGQGADADYFKSDADSLVQSLHLQQLDQASAYGRQVMGILRAFPQGPGTMPRVWMCHGCGTSSHPLLGILIDPDQIAAIQRRSGANSVAMLTFILDHEMAHQLQFARYGRDLYLRPAIELQFLEAQADLMAGEALFTSYPDASVTAQSGLLYKMLLAVYDLGGEQYALADHPSKSGRFLAARIGMQKALVDQTRNVALPGAGAEAARIAQQIDLRAGESDLDFSLRMAKRITQYNPIAARDLAYVFSTEGIHFDPDPEKRDVTYALNYLNQGSRALTVTMQVQCIAVLRQDPENLLRSLEASSNTHTFTVQPGQTHLVEGALKWNGDDAMMPRLIFAPDPFVLTEVHYADGSDVAADAVGKAKRLQLGYLPSEGERNSLQVGLSELVESATLEGYQGLAAGVGMQHKYSSTYPSNTPLPGALDAEVDLPRSDSKTIPQPYTTSTFLRTYDQAAAQIAFNNLVTLVRATLPSVDVPYGPKTWTEDAGNMEDGFRFYHDPFTITVRENSTEETTGSRTFTNHRVVLDFEGLKPTLLETSATPLDAVMAQIVNQADIRNLVSMKGSVDENGDKPDDPTDESIWWQALVLPAGLKECHLVKYPTIWQLNCNSANLTEAVGGTLLEQLKAAASNYGASMQSDDHKTPHRSLQMYSPKGTSIRVWLSVDKKGETSVELLVDEPER